MKFYKKIEELEDIEGVPEFVIRQLQRGNPVAEDRGEWYPLVLDDSELDKDIYNDMAGQEDG